MFSHTNVNKRLLILVGTLLLFGLFMLSSASAIVGFERFGNTYYFVIRQILLGLLPGIALAAIAFFIPLKVWRTLSPLALLLTFFLLVAVFLPGLGVTVGGARRWIKLGPIVFHVAEVAKLAFVISFSAWLAKRREQLDLHHGFLPFAVLVAIILGMIVAQPDIGTAIIFVSIAGALYFLAGGRMAHMGIAVLIGSGLFALLVKAAPYRLARIASFVNPAADPQGIGYHITQSLLAIGGGGWLGVGLGHSRQKFAYLPEVFGDSIFSIIAEELGFIGSVALLVFLVFFIRYIFLIARRQRDPFAYLLAAGIGSWFAMQSFVNIAALTGLVPLTGIPLPFISYGATALAVELAAVGILLRLSHEAKL